MFKRGFLPSANHLLAFEAVARYSSVAQAATELHLTQSAVSRQIQQLEEQIGVKLFQRVRQRLIITKVGQTYANDVRRALTALAESTRQAMSHNPLERMLNIAVLPTLGSRWLIPRLPRFHERYPGVTINLQARSEPFDFSSNSCDLAIHFGEPSWPNAQCVRLFDEIVVPVCSPEYMRASNIKSLDDLPNARLLQQASRPTQWAQWFEHFNLPQIKALAGPCFDQFSMISEAAIAGIGVGLLPRLLIEDEISRGKMQILFDGTFKTNGAYYLVTPDGRTEDQLIEWFKGWIVSEAEAMKII
jgi:LysR family transcriptional regulator, glycine cleavage system transcriptional activator